MIRDVSPDLRNPDRLRLSSAAPDLKSNLSRTCLVPTEPEHSTENTDLLNISNPDSPVFSFQSCEQIFQRGRLISAS